MMSASQEADSSSAPRSPEEKSDEPAAGTADLGKDDSTSNSTSDVKSCNTLDTAVDVTTDFGLPNYLYLYYIPSVPDRVKPELDKLIRDIQSWHAFEVGHVERGLRSKINSRRLPTDKTLTSRVRRSYDRALLLAWLREGLYW